MTSLPLVSVIMPVYNASRHLRDAFESIAAQDYQPLEIVVVDDGSTDQSAAMVQENPLVRYAYQENAGPGIARNRALEMARGELIAFLDADDLWPEGKLHMQVQRLLDDPTLDVISGRIQYLELPGADKRNLRFEGPDNSMRHVNLGAGVFRRRVFDTVGVFDPELRFSEDMDWFFRAREQEVNMTILDDITLIYRIHETNMTSNKTPQELQLPVVLKKSLVRRRTRGGGAAQNLRQFRDFADEKGV